MQDNVFADPETWVGGYYELAINLDVPSDTRLLTALSAIWSYPNLDGAFVRNNTDPYEQTAILLSLTNIAEQSRLYGVAKLNHEVSIACFTAQVRENGGDDWLYFGFPMGAIGRYFDVGGFPFDESDHAHWRNVLDSWLAKLGYWVYKQVQFKFAIIGHEVYSTFPYRSLKEIVASKNRLHSYLFIVEEQLKFFPYPSVTNF